MCRTEPEKLLANRTETYEKKDPRVAFRHKVIVANPLLFSRL